MRPEVVEVLSSDFGKAMVTVHVHVSENVALKALKSSPKRLWAWMRGAKRFGSSGGYDG